MFWLRLPVNALWQRGTFCVGSRMLELVPSPRFVAEAGGVYLDQSTKPVVGSIGGTTSRLSVQDAKNTGGAEADVLKLQSPVEGLTANVCPATSM